MGLFELKVSVPSQPSYNSQNSKPLADATKAVASSISSASRSADHRYTDNRQISLEETYGLINNWQSIYSAIGIWEIATIQETGIKLNNSKYNYMLLEKYEYPHGAPPISTHYLAHISLTDPFLMKILMESYRLTISGQGMLEKLDVKTFREKELPKMKLGWVPPKHTRGKRG